VSAESESTSEDSGGQTGDRPDTDLGPDSGSDFDPGSNFDLDSHPEPDPDGNSWMGYGLVLVFVGTLVLGLLRPLYPTASAIAIGSFLGLFGLFVAFLAFRERGRDS
jgi:hypothetical protein